MKTYKEFLTELFDKPAPVVYRMKNDTLWDATFKANGEDYRVYISYDKKAKDADVLFSNLQTGFNKTNLGPKTAGIVLATVLEVIREFLDEMKPDTFEFTAQKSDDDNSESRSKLYTTMVKRFIPKEYSVKISDQDTKTRYTLKRK